jgi:hypothetical protein
MKKPLLFSLLNKPIAYFNLQNSLSNQLESFTAKMRNVSLLLTILIALCFTTSSSYGQAADAANAIQICDGIWPQPAANKVTGTNDFPVGSAKGCLLNGENGSNWYWVKVTQAGTMAFDVQGVKANGVIADIDGAIWGPFTSVATGVTAIHTGTSPVRCSYAAGTGMLMRNSAVATSQGAGGTGRVKSLPVNLNEYYLIFVDNFDAGTIRAAISISFDFTTENTADYACPGIPISTGPSCLAPTAPSNDLGVKTARGVQPSGTFTFSQCSSYFDVPFKGGDGTFLQCYTVNSGANGNIGIVQQIQTYGTDANGDGTPDCSQPIAASRVATLTLAQPPPCGTPIAANVINAGNSTTLNPEWTGLIPNTNYVVCISTTMPAAVAGVTCNYRQSCLDVYHWPPPPPATFTFNCGGATLLGTFIANGTTGQSGTLTVPITGATAGSATFNVSSVATGFTGTFSTILTAGQTSVAIPVTFNGSGIPGNRTISVTSAQTSSTCSKVFTVGGCTAGTTAPVLGATTKFNVCPATTADLSGLVTSACPASAPLEWHTVSTGFSVGNKVATPNAVSTGTYYPVCFDATNTCYSPAPATGVTVSITTCTGPFTITQPALQTILSGTPKSGTVPSDVLPSGGTTPYVYSNGSLDPLCVAPIGATLLPASSNLTVSSTGAYSYTAPTTAGTYYFCVKVCDSATPTPTCTIATYKITVTAPVTITQPAPQTSAPNALRTGVGPTDLLPNGGLGALTYTNGSLDPLCVAPVGAMALPASSNLTINSSTGAYSYTTPSIPGTYYFCVKVCDSSSPTPSCAIANYKVTVTAPAFTVIQPAVQTGLVNTPKSGNAPSDLTPVGGVGAYVYSNGSADPACTPLSGATALPASSNLTISSTGAYSYTTPTTPGTYYFCVKVCDSATPTPSCAFATYKVVVTPPACAAGTVAPGVN